MRATGRASQSRDGGQATVELALVLPVAVLLALAIGQVGVVAVDSLLVHHAAREAARAAAVDPDRGVALAAARGSTGLAAERLEVQLSGGRESGETVTATVHYLSVTDLPLIGRLVGDVTLRSAVTIRVE